MYMPPQLILASASPRRRELLGALGLTYAVAPSDADEVQLPGEGAHAMAHRLSRAKAQAVAERHPQALTLAADTMVVLDGAVLGKPGSPAEAGEMLARLRGRRHEVYTGLALCQPALGRLASWVAITGVAMRAYGEAEVRAYIATGDPLDKAGAYAIQHPAFSPVDHLEDCYTNVMGLPLCHVYLALRAWGAEPPVHPLAGCPWAAAQGGCAWAGPILAGGWLG